MSSIVTWTTLFDGLWLSVVTSDSPVFFKKVIFPVIQCFHEAPSIFCVRMVFFLRQVAVLSASWKIKRAKRSLFSCLETRITEFVAFFYKPIHPSYLNAWSRLAETNIRYRQEFFTAKRVLVAEARALFTMFSISMWQLSHHHHITFLIYAKSRVVLMESVVID